MDFGEMCEDEFHGKVTAKYRNGEIFNEYRINGWLPPNESAKRKVWKVTDEKEVWFPVNQPKIIKLR